MRIVHTLLFVPLLLFLNLLATAESRILDARLHHLRIDWPREWSEFPEQPEAGRLELKFSTQANADEQTLSLRQQDVKQTWTASLNGKPLGRLTRDENDMIDCFAVPAGALRDGENVPAIEQSVGRRSRPDDIRVGDIRLDSRPVTAALSDATLDVEVLEADSGEPIPARITILNAEGALQSVGAISNDHLSVRPGTVFTSTGRARIPLPADSYTLHAGRGLLAWYTAPISTGPLEGVNNKIKLMQRRACGYRDVELFKLRILSLHTTRYELVG